MKMENITISRAILLKNQAKHLQRREAVALLNTCGRLARKYGSRQFCVAKSRVSNCGYRQNTEGIASTIVGDSDVRKLQSVNLRICKGYRDKFSRTTHWRRAHALFQAGDCQRENVTVVLVRKK